jgi:hypothetical protein
VRQVPIDVSVKRSPGWWMQRLFNQLSNPQRRRRLQLLHDYHSGNAPLPILADNVREAFCAFQKKSRTNFGELVVSAMSERMTIAGFRTALDGDTTGDPVASRLWRNASMGIVSSDVHDKMLTMGEAYAIVGAVDDETGVPVVTAEDPRDMVGEKLPGNPLRLQAALKVQHDDAEGEDRAYLFLPGQIWVARRPLTVYDAYPGAGTTTPSTLRIGFDPRSWDWAPDRSGQLPHRRIAAVRFDNKDGYGEYEMHTDLLDRINSETLDRLIIAAMQAFRQRAVRNLPDVYPEDHPLAGEQIDYDDVFKSDPAALWMLPEGAEMWESALVDMSGLLTAVKDDVTALAAVTRTPMHMLQPGGDNQSAEGAASQREGLVSKITDRRDRVEPMWAKVISLMLLHAGQANRADLQQISTMWGSIEKRSLAEKADSASKLAPVLPRRALLIYALDMTPDEADRTMTEYADDQLLAAQVAAASAAAMQSGTQQQDTGVQNGQQQDANNQQQGQGGSRPDNAGQNSGAVT